jgi:hypothetical protein
VVPTPTGGLRAVRGAVDGGLAATRLAIELDADALLLLTGGGAGDAPAAIEARGRAIDDFLAAGGWLGAVGPLNDAAAMLRGEVGLGANLVEWGSGVATPVAVPGA